MFLFHREGKLRLRVQDMWRECSRDSVLLPAARSSDLRSSGHSHNPGPEGLPRKNLLSGAPFSTPSSPVSSERSGQDLRIVPLGCTPVCCTPRLGYPKWPDCLVQGPRLGAAGMGRRSWLGSAAIVLCDLGHFTALSEPQRKGSMDWLTSSFLFWLFPFCVCDPNSAERGPWDPLSLDSNITFSGGLHLPPHTHPLTIAPTLSIHVPASFLPPRCRYQGHTRHPTYLCLFIALRLHGGSRLVCPVRCCAQCLACSSCSINIC